MTIDLNNYFINLPDNLQIQNITRISNLVKDKDIVKKLLSEDPRRFEYLLDIYKNERDIIVYIVSTIS